MPEGTQTSDNGQPTGTGGAATQTAGVDKVAELESNFQKLSSQLNGISAALRTMQKPPAQAADAAATESQHVTVKSLKAELEARDAASRDLAVDATIEAFCAQNGITDSQAKELFHDHVVSRHGSKLRFEKGKVVFDDPSSLDGIQGFEVLGHKILQSHGRTLQAPVKTPGPVGSRTQFGASNTTRPQGVEIPDVSTMSPQEQANWMIKYPAAANQLMRELAANAGYGRQ